MPGESKRIMKSSCKQENSITQIVTKLMGRKLYLLYKQIAGQKLPQKKKKTIYNSQKNKIPRKKLNEKYTRFT